MLLMSSTNLFRLGGLSALLGGVLFVIVYLINVGVNLFLSGPDELGGTASATLRIQAALGLPGQVLLALGLVGLWARYSEATGTIGFIGFLWAFVGMFFSSGIIWAALLADLGWALFGVSCLRARVYPPTATMLLIVSAVVSTVAGVLVGSPGNILLAAGVGTEGIFNTVMYVGVSAELILNTTIAWLGLTLLTMGSQTTQQPKHTG
jgi:hypothetical protein